MSIEKCREEFEVWWSQDSQAELRSSCAKGWAGVVWQASREALVIELPPVPEAPEDPEEAIDDSHMDAYHASVGMRHACSKLIEAAGLKVKS